MMKPKDFLRSVILIIALSAFGISSGLTSDNNNSVSVIKVPKNAKEHNNGFFSGKVSEIPVGKEPRCVAITPDDKMVFVTNMIDGTVSVIDADRPWFCRKTIRVGTEPFGCAVTPDGRKLYVANFGSDDVSVISTRFERVIKTIKNVGPKPRGVAITGPSHRFERFSDIKEFLKGLRDDLSDDNEMEGSDAEKDHSDGKTKVYVTQFLAQLRDDDRPVDQKEGLDDGKEGRVTVISAASNKVIGTVTLNPLADTGFKSDGVTLPPVLPVPPTPPTPTTTGAFPNLLQSVVIAGSRAYLPNTASSPNGPFKFNVNVQGFLSVFDITTDTDSGQTINMNNGVQNEDPKVRLFITNPIAIAFERSGTEGWVVSAATDRIIRVTLDANGTPTINPPPPPTTPPIFPPDTIVRVLVGSNPKGLC
jgi:YVTN family beta-propeller protein